MYNIIVNDYQNNTQFPEANYSLYLTEARELCIYLATEFILKYQGSTYLKQLFYEKTHTRKGYFMVKKDTPHFTKITIFHKEPNGLFISGALKRIRSFVTVKTMKTNIYDYSDYETDFECYMDYDNVLTELNAKPNLNRDL